MPNIQMLNLADVYAKADAGQAAQQQATLRDLQIGTAQRQQQQEMGLSEIAQQSRNPETGEIDPDIMAAGAAARGYHEPALKYQGMATDAKTKKQALVKSRTDFMGQIAYVNDQETLDEFHERFREFDPKAAAVFKEQYSVYNPESINAIKQKAMMGMTSYQRAQLESAERIAKLKAEAKENAGMKASDTNALTRLAAQSLNLPFTPQPDGSTLISALNPQQASKLSSLVGRASQNFMAGKGKLDHATAFNNAMDELRGTFPDLPRVVRVPGGMVPAPGVAAPAEAAPPGGFQPISADDRQKAQLIWQDESKRPALLARLKEKKIDSSFLTSPQTRAAPSGPGIPSSTVKSSAQVYGMQQERDAAKNRIVAIENRLRQLQREMQMTREGQRSVGLSHEVQALAQERQGLVEKVDTVTKELGYD